MANPEHLKKLSEGVEAWNAWRQYGKGYFDVDLGGSDLRGRELEGVDFYMCNLEDADLTKANLANANLHRARVSRATLKWTKLDRARLAESNFREADLTYAHLDWTKLTFAKFDRSILRDASLENVDASEADFTGADLFRADLSNSRFDHTSFSRANLRGAHLSWTHFDDVDLTEADLGGAVLQVTIFTNTDLSGALSLDDCDFRSPCVVDHTTLAQSSVLPLNFLRGCGLPDVLIDAIPDLRADALSFRSCFISYSSEDQAFAETLLADLKGHGVRCWFAPHNLPIGAETRKAVHEAIGRHDKLLLILSKHSVESQWVEDEVERALELERRDRRIVLFPIRLDDAVMESAHGWPVSVRNVRNIGDF